MPLDLTMADEAGPSIAPKIPLPVIIHYASHKRDELAIDIKPLLEAISPEEFRTLLRLLPEDKCPHVDIGPIISSYKDVTTKTTYHQLFNDIVATLKGMPHTMLIPFLLTQFSRTSRRRHIIPRISRSKRESATGRHTLSPGPHCVR